MPEQLPLSNYITALHEESTATYTKLFENLKERGIDKVWRVVSDAHKGLVKAARESFVGCSWQRCKVHFMRNILGCVFSRDKKFFAEKLKQIWLQPDYDSAKKYADWLMNEYEGKYPQAIATLEEGLEESLQFFNFRPLTLAKLHPPIFWNA